MSNDDKKVKAVFFDLGNVIVRFDAAIMEEGFKEFSRSVKDTMLDYIVYSETGRRYMEGKISSSQFYMRTIRKFKMKIKYHEFYAIWNSIFFPYPETEEIIKAIKDKYPDIKLILVSDTNDEHFKFIKENYDILDYMDHLVLSYEVGAVKPSVKVYNRALKLAGAIPREVLYFDDRADLIKAARKMGIRAFHFKDHADMASGLMRCGITI